MKRRVFIPCIGSFLVLTFVAMMLISIENGAFEHLPEQFNGSLPSLGFFAQYGLSPSE